MCHEMKELIAAKKVAEIRVMMLEKEAEFCDPSNTKNKSILWKESELLKSELRKAISIWEIEKAHLELIKASEKLDQYILKKNF